MIISRVTDQPSANTMSIPSVAAFVRRWEQRPCVDPFARDCQYADITNDLDPKTRARYHLPADEFLAQMRDEGRRFQLAIFDPPYSPRQISECYANVGLNCTGADTQNGRLYRVIRRGIDAVLEPGGVVVSMGWNSCGFDGYELLEVMLVCHGGAHNDTIVRAERKLQGGLL